MDPFLSIFFAIDSSKSEQISVRDLTNYVEANNLDPDIVKRWTRIFDPRNTGRFELAKICDVFSIPIDVARAQRDSFLQSGRRFSPQTPGLGPDVVVISAQMPLAQQIWITDTARLMASSPNGFQEREEASKQMKQEFDKMFGRTWTAVIIQGSFWISFSHSKDASIQFRVAGHSFLVWRTPEQFI